MNPEDYLDEQGKDYRPPTRAYCGTIPVLEFLWGHPWDQLALNSVHALRPSFVRVGDVQTEDFVIWRVSVAIDEDNVIRRIDQEVELGGADVADGQDLMQRVGL